MPNAAAHFDDDFGIETPVRKKAPRRAATAKAGAGKRKKKGKARFAFDTQRVTRWAAIGMSGTVVVGILVNALILQKGHHPAPLFGKSIALGQGAAASHPVAPAPASKKADAASAPAVAALPAKREATREDDAKPSSDDAIGRLLQGGSPAPADRSNTKTVLGVQRALTRLGFTVKQTGTFGPQTRKAIEHFEKDRHLAVKGEVSRRLVKMLAAESHIKIEQ